MDGLINTIIKTTSVCDGNAKSVGGGRGWLAGDTDGLAGWPMTVGVVEVGVVDTRYGVSQPEADVERYRCAYLHRTQGLAGRGDGYQCGLDWGRSNTFSGLMRVRCSMYQLTQPTATHCGSLV